jgi:cell division inhibitor SepF
MAGIWQKTLFYLGLVDEDGDEPFEPRGREPAGAYRPGAPEDQMSPPRQRRVAADPRYREEAGPPGSDEESQRMRAGAGVSGRRVEPPITARRRTPADSALADAGVIVQESDTPSVRTITEAELRTQIIAARSYSDAQALADYIRAALPVVLDLRKVEPAMVRRLVDFASGLTYALGGSMRKIGQGVILVTPANVNIPRDEKARLAEMGYYQASEG